MAKAKAKIKSKKPTIKKAQLKQEYTLFEDKAFTIFFIVSIVVLLGSVFLLMQVNA